MMQSSIRETAVAEILLVDDNEPGRYAKARMLRGAGFAVVEAGTGQAALDAVRERRPALVLLDVKLPDISGHDVCRHVKASDPSIMVLQMSAAFTGSRDRASALFSGADSYLVEPFEPAELVASVEALMRLHRAEQDLRKANESLERKVEERTRTLAEANVRLQKEMEQRSSAEQALMHAQKLDAIGQLTGGIAHDFNNLLTVVLGNLELLQRGVATAPGLPIERQQHLVAGAMRAGRDCERLTSQLLAFARRNPAKPEIVEVNRALEEFAPLLRRAVGEQIIVELALAPRLWPCRVDLSQLEAAILNLAVNARDAMPAGGTFRIETLNAQICDDRHDILRPSDLSPGDYVVILASDTGIGIEPDAQRHVFEPFFTTKEIGKGTGLGLSQVYGFTHQSGGSVALQSWVSKGTQFALYLPRAMEGLPGTLRSGWSPEPLSVGTETILVVDDNVLVRGFVTDTLASLGYRVLEAGDGPEALAVLRNQEQLDLLLTDVMMPNGMSGVDLALEVKKQRPGVKIILSSGVSETQVPAVEGAPASSYLAKPYRVTELAARVREALGKP